MADLFGGIVGGLGLFLFGMWLLTENLKRLASGRFRQSAQRWTANRFGALFWGVLAGGITQSMTALTFITVSILRSGLISTTAALAVILGGTVGVSAIVMVVIFDIRTASLYVLGLAGAAAAIEGPSKYRAVASSFLGGAMIVFGLVLLKDSVAPLADEAWFGAMVEGVGNSLVLALAVGALLTFVVQSSSAVSVFGISLAAIGVVSVDQAIMIIYGTLIGSGAIVCVLSAGLTGRARQIAMYLVGLNVLVCAVLIPLLYAEIHLGIPAMKAVVIATGLEPARQLALVYLILAVLPVPLMLFGLKASARILERLWPISEVDKLTWLEFNVDHASVDVETSLALVEREQRRALRMMSGYFERVRLCGEVRPFRQAFRAMLTEIDGFLSGLRSRRPLDRIEDCNVLTRRQKMLSRLDESLSEVCTALVGLADRPLLDEFRTNICEGVDSVFLSFADAIESGDRTSWTLAAQLTGDRRDMMRQLRAKYLESGEPLKKSDTISVIRITNAVEEVFVQLSELQIELNPYSGAAVATGRSNQGDIGGLKNNRNGV